MSKVDTDQIAEKLNQAKSHLSAMTGGRRRKSRASSRKSSRRGSKKGGARRSRKASRGSSRKSSRRGSKKGGARRSRKASRASSRKSARGSRKSSRRSSRGSLRRGVNPAFAANGKVARYIEKQLGVKFSVGIAKLLGKMNAIAKNGLKNEKDYAEKAKRAMEAFDDHLAKQGKGKIIAEIEKHVEEARRKRMKK